MTKQIDLIAKLVIIGMLFWLTMSVNKLNEKVFPDPNVMIPLSKQMDRNFEDAVKNLLIQKLQEIE